MEISKTKVLDAWKGAVKAVLEHGEPGVDSDGRELKELRNLSITVDGSSNDVAAPMETLSGSKVWLYPSKEELYSVMFKETHAPIYDYTYGGRIFGFRGKLDQINGYVIPLLKKNPASRRATITVYDPASDSNMLGRNVPAIIYMHFQLNGDALCISASVRSNDMFFGWPANIFQISAIQKYVAERLNAKPGPINMVSVSAHIFRDNYDDAEKATR